MADQPDSADQIGPPDPIGPRHVFWAGVFVFMMTPADPLSHVIFCCCLFSAGFFVPSSAYRIAASILVACGLIELAITIVSRP